jgi:hypothetical protein
MSGKGPDFFLVLPLDSCHPGMNNPKKIRPLSAYSGVFRVTNVSGTRNDPTMEQPQ